MTDLQSIRATAEAIAREAGTLAMGYFRQPLKQHSKATAIDIVTEADEAVEAYVIQALQQSFPDHQIVGEESGQVPGGDAAFRWYVDPIDGTTNFANGIPVFSVSLALTDGNMQPLVGVVYNPALDECFSAAQGHGAAMNGVSLSVSNKTHLSDCVIASGFPYDKHTSPQNNLHAWATFTKQVRGIRRLGSAALDCCYVAAGYFDGYWEQKVKPWDVLAGLLCVAEAGGIVSDYQGDDDFLRVEAGRVIAANPTIHAQMVALLRDEP